METNLSPFDEEAWGRETARLARNLHAVLSDWLQHASLPPHLLARVEGHALRGEEARRTDSPALYAWRFAAALGLDESSCARLSVACTLFWSAADLADDLDDGTLPLLKSNVTVNDVCTLLFLAQEAFTVVSPEIASFAARAGLRMAAGQALDLDATDRRVPVDAWHIAEQKAGAEFELFFQSAARLAERAVDESTRLGRATGVALQAVSDVIDIYVNPVSEDFLGGKWSLPLARLRTAGDSRARELRELEAMARDREDVLIRVRFLAADASRQILQEVMPPVHTAWEQVRSRLVHPEAFAPVIAWIEATVAALVEVLAELTEPPRVTRASQPEILARATDYLCATTGVAEEHRWGLFGKPYVKAPLYPAIFRAEALAARGRLDEPAIGALLAYRDEDGWRYYPHEREIPPDADDTGLMLGVLAHRLAPDIVEASARQLVNAFTHEGIRTWMGSGGETVEWLGKDCTATLANAVWGLVESGHGASVPAAVWSRLENAALRGNENTPFYGAPMTRWFVHRALAAGAKRHFVTAEQGAELRNALLSQVAVEQKLGGNTGDVIETAAAALAVAAWEVPFPSAPLTASWLAERQEIDGSWPCPPVFMSVGVGYRGKAWGHPVISTSMALLALTALTNQA